MKLYGLSLMFALMTLLLPPALCANDNEVRIGAGPYVQSQPYSGVDPEVMPTPVIFFDNRLFYVRWLRAGAYFLGDSRDGLSWGLSLTAQPRTFGYKSSDSEVLAGMSERRDSWEGGLAFSMKSDALFVEVMALHDLLNRSDGSLMSVEVGREQAWKKWYVLPSVILTWYSKDFNDYYYGVRRQESTLVRPTYNAEAGVNAAIQTFVGYRINQNWMLAGNLRVDYLDATVRNSPIVNENFMTSGMISLLYCFTASE